MVSESLVRSIAWVIVPCVLALVGVGGCGAADDGDGGGGGGVPVGGAGIGGAGIGGAGIGGVGAGGAGVAGSAGMGGAGTAGGAGAGTGGAAGAPAMTVAGCEVAVMADAATLHAGASEVLTAMTPCGFSSCHAGSGKAGLILAGATNLATLMVDKPACQAPNLSVVKSGGGQAALDGSYLWIKLAGAADPSGLIMGDAATWGMGGACGQTPSAPYGVRMPQMASAMTTSEDRLAKIRNWICGGAPGPM
jgi:hypothetical protein